MNGWFIAIIVLQVLSIGINLAKHGEPRANERYSAGGALISAAIMLSLVYMAIVTGF